MPFTTASQPAASTSVTATVAPQLGQFFGHRSAEAARGTGDEDVLTGKIGVRLRDAHTWSFHAAAVGHDVAGGGLRKMTADHERAGIAKALHEFAARARCLGLVHVEARFGGGHGDLDRVVHQITGDDGLLAARIDQHADMSRRVARRGDERDLVGEAEVRIDELLEP